MRTFAFHLVLICLLTSSAHSQWVKQNVNTTASFRGLSVVNDKVVWASGTGGTVIRTIDGGKSWNVIVVPGAEKLDFRDIEAFDANTAYILSIGNGESSRIYKTTDGGSNWNLQFKNANPKAFFDAMACWDKTNCIAMSDPVEDDRKNARFLLLKTVDGSNWQLLGRGMEAHARDKIYFAKSGEAAFAASGTCLITIGKNYVYIVSGGSDARVFRSWDRGLSWSVNETPIVRGSSGSGIFSIALRERNSAIEGVIVGGNYEKPGEAINNIAFTSNGGGIWELGKGLTGYRSGVAYVDKNTIIVVGPNGTDLSGDSGKSWKNLGDENLNAVAAKGRHAVWAVGPRGLVVRMK